MQCPQCRFENPPQMKFCGECGERLQRLCPNCAAEAPPGFKFCGECGTPLTSPAATPSHPTPAPAAGRPHYAPPLLVHQAGPERAYAPPQLFDHPAAPPPRTGREPGGDSEIKQATMLTAELVLTPAEQVGPELLHLLLGRLSELARAEVERYGGTLRQFMGQGFMALFGAPVAYEDHAQRAALAALGAARRMAEQAAEIETSHGIRWTLRVGLATGPMVVGGTGDMVVGETTQQAARLQNHAAANEILVGEATRRLIQSQMTLEKTTPLRTPDGTSIPVWRVLASSSEQHAWPFRQHTLSPLVGRRREIQLLEELREQAREGRGQVVGLIGDAGAGKSRLLHELFRRTFPGRRVAYLRGQCLSYGSGIPYLPLIDMIRKASRISEQDRPAEIAAKLRRSLDQVGSDPAQVLPYLLRLLGVREGSESLDELEPQALQQRTFAAMRRMLLDAGRRSLVVVELEDLHWIDRTSEEFLDSLIEVMAAARFLLIMAYRVGYQPRWLEKSYATQIPIRRLNKDESRELVGSILERADLPADLGGELFEKAEGNPFFLEEIARALTERGGDEAAQGAPIPDTVQGVLMARIDRLPEVHKHLLRTASVLGREISLELLTEIWDRDEALEPVLDDLQRWEFLYKTPSEGQTAHYFRHALTQDVAYQSLLESRRRTLHAQAAEALERLYADRLEDVYDRLVYHYPKAGQPAKTVHYLTLFAERAAASNAHTEAAKALRDALEHAARLPEDVRDRRRVEVLLKLAESLLPLADFPETLELCEGHREIVDALDDPNLSGPFHFWLAHTHTYLGNQEATRAHAHRAIEAARACGDETTEGKACYVLGRDGFWSGRFEDGIENSLRAVVLLERSGDPWWQGQAYWVAGFNHYVLGQLDEGLKALQRAYKIGEALDDYRLDTSWSIGYFYASLGEADEGIRQCRAGLDRSQDPLNTAVATGFLGHAHLQKGELDEAISLLGDSVSRLREAGMAQLQGWFSAFLGEAHLERGNLDAARQAADEGIEASTAADFHYGVGLAQRALGRIEAAMDHDEASAVRLDEAADTFRRLQVPFEQARTELERARLANQRGDRETAGGALREARRIFTELHVPSFVDRAEELASEFGIALS